MGDEFLDLSEYYDELYVKPEQYELEANKTIDLVATYKLSDGADLLDLACGTGGHIPYWRKRHCNVTGIDASPTMLARAIRKFPAVDFHLGDMVDFSLNREFDAIACLYGSIGFVRTLENLYRALATFALHLKHGGVLCVTPWSTQEEFEPAIVVDAAKHSHIRIARMENVKRKAMDLVEVDIHHLVGRDGKVTYRTQSIKVGLFSTQQYLDAMCEAKLELMEYYQGSDIRMGAFIARKPLPD
jgi:SAM-dependent methyltransferase